MPPLHLFHFFYGEDGTLLTCGRGQPGYGSLCVCVWPAGKSAEMVLPPWVETYRRRRLIEGNAKSLRLHSDLEKDFAAGVYLFEAHSPPRFLSWGVKVLQYGICPQTQPAREGECNWRKRL
jgi:hypothetical protein